jgi:hypothetical protein
MGTIPVNMFRFVVQGTIDGVQGWSTSVWAAPEPTAHAFWTGPDLDAAVTLLSSDFDSALAAIAGDCWGAATVAHSLTAYCYNAGAAKASLVSNPAPLTAAGSGGARIPSYCSLVASLRSDTAGKSGMGRNYLPYTKGNLDTNGQATATITGDVATAWAGLCTTINSTSVPATSITGFITAVASFTKSAYYPLSRVVVNSVLDVQHRRSDKEVAANTGTHGI